VSATDPPRIAGGGDRVEALVRDIEGSPQALARLLDRWAGPDPRLLDGVSRVAFVGLGSSRYAGLVAAASLRAHGVAAWAGYAGGAQPTAAAADLLLVAISASGATAEVVEAANRHRGISRVVAVTGDPDGPLAAAADAVVGLEAGVESAGISTRTFRATLAALALIGQAVTGGGPALDALRPAVDALDDVIASRDLWLFEAADRLDGAPAIDVVADAADLGLAQQAALMLREAPRLPAGGHETADWSHTQVYLAYPGHRVVVFTGSPSDGAVVDIVAGRGGESITVGSTTVARAVQHIETPHLDDPFADGIVRSVVGELLAAELWRRTRAEERRAP